MQNAGRIQSREHDQRGHVGETGEEEERNGPPADVLGAHSASTQCPPPQGKSARSTYREQRVRTLLRHPDLVTQPPAHPSTEHRPENEHVRQRREHLQNHAGDEPPGRGIGDLAPQLPQARDRQHDNDDHQTHECKLQQAAPKPPRAQLIRHPGLEHRRAVPGTAAITRRNHTRLLIVGLTHRAAATRA